MTVTATETTSPQVNGETGHYSSKFLPKVTSIPMVTSLKKQVFTSVPQAETFSKYVEDGLSTAFSYTKGTPLRPILIKLNELAATGLGKFEKEVPIVTAPTDEVLKKAKVDKGINFFVHWYTVSLDFACSVFDKYKGTLDQVLIPFLDRFEPFVGTKPQQGDAPIVRFKRLGGAAYEKTDAQVASILNKSKETVTSIYSTYIVPAIQTPQKQFVAQKDYAKEKVSPYVSEATARYTKAEGAAKDAWTKTKPDISGPNSVLPTLKSGAFTVLTFVYKLAYPDAKTPSPKKMESDINSKLQEQTNGLVSGVDITDEVKKRPNGMAS
jgi:hypothetical protein